MSYCREHRLDPRIDSSNLSLSFFRNRLRLQLLPLLRQYNPGVDQALLRLADIAREDSAFIEQQASELWDEVARQEDNAIRLDRKQTARLPVALQRQILRTAVARLIGYTRDIEASHIEAARDLLNKPVGKRLSLPHGLTCHGEYDELVIASPARNDRGHEAGTSPATTLSLQDELPLKVPGETALPGWKVRASIIRERPHEGAGIATSRQVGTRNDKKGPWAGTDPATTSRDGLLPHDTGAVSADFDLQKTGSELFVRRRRPGDRFQPLGMNTPKKVQDFMVDARIPRSWRGRIPIVCSPRQVIWIAGWRIDDRVKVTEASKEILRLEFIKSH